MKRLLLVLVELLLCITAIGCLCAIVVTLILGNLPGVVIGSVLLVDGVMLMVLARYERATEHYEIRSDALDRRAR